MFRRRSNDKTENTYPGSGVHTQEAHKSHKNGQAYSSNQVEICLGGQGER